MNIPMGEKLPRIKVVLQQGKDLKKDSFISISTFFITSSMIKALKISSLILLSNNVLHNANS